MTIMKLIRCKVAAAKRQAFCVSQQAWQPMADCDGFIAQCGGWEAPWKLTDWDNARLAAPKAGLPELHSPITDSDAIIVGMWRSEADLSQFMAQEHDVIFDKSQQQMNYLSCKVNRFNLIRTFTTQDAGDNSALDINHQLESNASNIPTNNNGAQVLHISQFDGVAEIDAFINSIVAIKEKPKQAQKPSNNDAPCPPPLSINLWQHSHDDSCLLLSTLWDSPQDYLLYCQSAEHAQVHSRLSAHCHSLQVSVIKLEVLWDI